MESVRRMGIALQRDPSAARLAVAPWARSAAGTVRTGALAALADCAAGLAALYDAGLAAHATTDLTVTATGLPTAEGAVLRASPRVVRRRRSSAVLHVDVHDERSGALVATSIVAFTEFRDPGALPGLEPTAAPWPPGDRYLEVEEVLPVRIVGTDLELAIEGDARNMAGNLGGATSSVMAEEAAAHAVRSAGLARLDVPTDLAISFLAPGRVGPVRSRSVVLGAGDGWARASVELEDEGAAGTPIVLATAGFGRRGPIDGTT
jgi:acyl-coenzyme A thioesterase PaaI-like protein